jgi:hypothetical protein
MKASNKKKKKDIVELSEAEIDIGITRMIE